MFHGHKKEIVFCNQCPLYLCLLFYYLLNFERHLKYHWHFLSFCIFIGCLIRPLCGLLRTHTCLLLLHRGLCLPLLHTFSLSGVVRWNLNVTLCYYCFHSFLFLRIGLVFLDPPLLSTLCFACSLTRTRLRLCPALMASGFRRKSSVLWHSPGCVSPVLLCSPLLTVYSVHFC